MVGDSMRKSAKVDFCMTRVNEAVHDRMIWSELKEYLIDEALQETQRRDRAQTISATYEDGLTDLYLGLSRYKSSGVTFERIREFAEAAHDRRTTFGYSSMWDIYWSAESKHDYQERCG
jgi:hypothetical protein